MYNYVIRKHDTNDYYSFHNKVTRKCDLVEELDATIITTEEELYYLLTSDEYPSPIDGCDRIEIILDNTIISNIPVSYMREHFNSLPEETRCEYDIKFLATQIQ